MWARRSGATILGEKVRKSSGMSRERSMSADGEDVLEPIRAMNLCDLLEVSQRHASQRRARRAIPVSNLHSQTLQKAKVICTAHVAIGTDIRCIQ